MSVHPIIKCALIIRYSTDDVTYRSYMRDVHVPLVSCILR